MKLEEPKIIFEDQDLVVINKPPFWVVNDADSHHDQTLQQWFKTHVSAQPMVEWQTLVPADFDDTYGDPEAIFADRQGMVHRLDKDTSGVVIFAKNPGCLVALLQQFRQRQTEKEYVCLVHGKFKILEDIITLPIARSTNDRKKFTVDISGRVASTHYKVQHFYSQLDKEKIKAKLLKQFEVEKVKLIVKRMSAYQGFSLISCWPKTGRTHQIRVHFTALKHPLVGDAMYTGSRRKALDPLWCRRQFLHAAKLSFIHPRTQQKVTFEAALPADLTQALSLLIEAD